MEKAVMISIRPKWCELIASGKKTIEVRKTVPRLETPFRCYIYETRGDERAGNAEYNYTIKGNGRGRVIGEFVCDKAEGYARFGYACSLPRYMKSCPGGYPATEIHYHSLQLTPNELEDYGRGAPLWGWHISELKIYDTPRKITEFKRWNRTEQNAPCAHTKVLYEPCESCTACNLTKAPQSWCYVEV